MHRPFSKLGLQPNSFTLVELLVVMAIIAILAALTLAGASAVMNTAGRSRAKSEIQAMSAGLESYKTDNGIYPPANTFAPSGPPTGNYPIDPGSANAVQYQTSAQILYQALSGKVYYFDTNLTTKSYMSFKTGQLGNYKQGASTSTYVVDPFGYAYGYSTGDGQPQSTSTQYPYNGIGFFDLWSTGGLTQVNSANQNPTNSWIGNWN